MKENKQKKLLLRNWLLIFHLFFTVMFLGGSFTQWVLLITILNTDSGNILTVSHSLMHTVDLSLIIPGLLGVIITGVMLSIKTHWGFTKYYWIITKEVLTLLIFGLGNILNIFVQRSIKITSSKGLHALQNPDYLFNRNMLLMAAAIQTTILVFIVVISVLKPWGKRKKKIISLQE
ncbi:hypothetical protein PB1_02425 [Bacillus methanolicus PB1]|uniref:DUF2269 domain-containing protein n=1 Tax=Bacillus methanolicus PB1 TaxID=997296 RepID=I3E5I7_BACMT|nr:hypothetical protein [Bacillus methanolicus]EIJ81758.1 hypothetical protein PB1_02425 [Bacillus methanolicus PB1]